MSYIDVFAHRMCGVLAGRNLYEPLEFISGEFEADIDCLVLGGGSGESNPIIFEISHVIGKVADEYAEHMSCLTCFGYEENGCEQCDHTGFNLNSVVGTGAQALGLTLQNLRDLAELLGVKNTNYTHLGGNDWFDIITQANKDTNQAIENIENWLEIVVGEYAVVMLSDKLELKDEKTAETFSAFQTLVRSFGLYAHVRCFAPGYTFETRSLLSTNVS